MLIPPPPDSEHPTPDGHSTFSTAGRYHVGFLNDMDYAYDFEGPAGDPTTTDAIELLDKTVSALIFKSFTGRLTVSNTKGTSEFMSAELVLSKETHHHARHDIESFFWVLLYVTLVFDGPRREIAYKDRDGGSSQPFSTYHDRADLPTHARARSSILTAPDSVASCQKHMRPYFESLKPLVLNLREVIFGPGVEGYKIVQQAVGKHQTFLKVLTQFCQTLPDVDRAHDIPTPLDLLYSQSLTAPNTPTAIASSTDPQDILTSYRIARSGSLASVPSMTLRTRLKGSGQSGSQIFNSKSLQASTQGSSGMSRTNTIAVMSSGKRTSDQSGNIHPNSASKRSKRSSKSKRF